MKHDPTMRPCLYCDTPSGRRTAEHVLHDALGTRLVLHDDVCHECNTTAFSPLDTKFIHFVRTYAYWDHPQVPRTKTIVQDGHPMVLNEHGLWESVRVVMRGADPVEHVRFTQIIFIEDGRVGIAFDPRDPDPERTVRRIRDDLAAPDTLTIARVVVDAPTSDGPPVQPALIWSAPRKYAARAGNDAAVTNLIELVRSGRALAGRAPRREREVPATARPYIYTRIEIPFGVIERVSVKIAINLVCRVVGPLVARHPALADARRYARYGDPAALGTYLVQQWGTGAEARDPFLLAIARPSRHTLLFCIAQGTPIVVIALYGRPFATIRLTTTPAPDLVPAGYVAAVLFDYDSRHHEIVCLPEETGAFAAALPGLVGMSET